MCVKHKLFASKNMLQEFLDQLSDWQTKATAALESVETLEALMSFQSEFLGKKSALQTFLKQIKDFSPEEKRAAGPAVQSLQQFIRDGFATKQSVLETAALEARLAEDWLDTTKSLPRVQGAMHPLSHVQYKIEDIFTRMGFQIADGPEVETEWNNFDALNIPPTHPARDMQDTFFVDRQHEDSRQNTVLRTHTSNLQIRSMLEQGAPLRLIAPGRVYRNEELDATHDAVFYQFECLVVDEGISMAHLKGTIEKFLEAFFEKPVKFRFRPGYFPFVEPGLEVDIWFEVPGKPGKWLELLGAGMVHPEVLKNCNIDPDKYSGFAFGLGLTRLAMMTYSIDDLRWLNQPKVDFLSQF